MTRPIGRLALALLVPFAAVAFANAAPAKDKAAVDVKSICEKDVQKKIKTKFPHAHDTQLTVSREWQQSSTESGVGGTGTYLAADKKPRNFEWTCVYDVKKNKVLDVSFDKPKKAPKETK
jgi:hypothetical protein